MSAPTLLLSDLHLPPAESPLRAAFAAFLRGPARNAAAVYILGDLFDAWIGDDLGLADYAEEVGHLRGLTDCGVPVYLMHGNRDFLIGPRFAAAAGVTLLPDPLTLMLGGVPTLLSHGDLFCTDDRAYQRWRRVVHRPWIQGTFLNLPRSLRRRIAGSARHRSEHDKQRKASAIMDVNANAIDDAFEHYGVNRIIHGHTHRPAEHRTEVRSRRVERWVLADWKPSLQQFLSCGDTRLQRIELG